MAFVWHINFHTFHNKPLFENPEYEAFIRNAIFEIAKEKEIPLLGFEIMPTHAHLITLEFPDFPRSKMIQHLKGESSLKFFENFPDCRYELGGGHLWQVSYDKVLITTHIQYHKTAEYVRNQRKWWKEKHKPQIEI